MGLQQDIDRNIEKHGAEGVVEYIGYLNGPAGLPAAPSCGDCGRILLRDRFVKWQNGPLDMEFIAAPIRGLPEPFEGFTIAVISDIHMTRRFMLADEVLAGLSSVPPNLICILGDTADGGTVNVKPLEPFLERLASLAPCAAIFGNNEYASAAMADLRAAYERAGIALLEDQCVRIERGGAVMRLVGLQDPWAYVARLNKKREPGQPNTEPIKPVAAPNTFDVLMIHRPHRASRYMMQGFAFAMAGHAHGGQWRLPGGRGVFSPGQGLFPKLTSGLYWAEGKPFVVSRGLGNHEFPIRLHNRPHLPIIKLIKQ